MRSKFTWRNRLGCPAPPGEMSPSVYPESQKTFIFNIGIKNRVTMWRHLSIVHPLRIPIPMCKIEFWFSKKMCRKLLLRPIKICTFAIFT